MAIQLFSHNMQAYQAMRGLIEKNGKAAIIHPTGTGKSFIAFKWIEEHHDKRFVWLSPSDYIFATQIEGVKQSVSDFPVQQITFLTYAKLMLMTDEELAQLQPDGIVLDEFHRCGAKGWGEGVMRLLSMYKAAKLLGLSATKIRYLDGQRDMADELFEGCIASEITLGEAIVRGILPAPVYVTTLYRMENELAAYQQRIDAIRSASIRTVNQMCMDELRRAVKDAEGLEEVFAHHIQEKNGKYLVFCSSESHMRQLRRQAQKWFAGIDPEVRCYTAYSADPMTSRAYRAFVHDDSDHLKLLFSINMFNEGVHVPGVSGVILFRPTISPIIYKQQIGRALTTGSQHTPLILDIINNFEGLRSYGTIQAEMDEAVERLRREYRAHEIMTERFMVIEQMHDCVELFRKLESSLSSTWDHYFAAAASYYEQHGDLKVPRDYMSEGGLCLGLWVQRQREARKGKGEWVLTEGQIERLDRIGMIWESKTDIAWQGGYEHAMQYASQYGALDVPRNYECEDGFKLGTWIHRLRQQKNGSKKNTMLTMERIKQLESIGMRWMLQEDGWETGYREALAFFKENGHLDVPGDYVCANGFALAAWLSTQRQAREGQFRRKMLSKERVAKLDAIGMVWETRRERQWRQFYTAARAYYEQHGNLRIPYQYETQNGLKLGMWVCNQRRLWKQGRKRDADMEQYRLLDEMGLFSSNSMKEKTELADAI